MKSGNRTWSASASGSYFLPPGSRDSCVVEAVLHDAFWCGLSCLMSEGSNMTSSSLPTFKTIFFKTILSYQSFTRKNLKASQENWIPLCHRESIEKPCWEPAAQFPSLHADLKVPLLCHVLVLAGSTRAREQQTTEIQHYVALVTSWTKISVYIKNQAKRIYVCLLYAMSSGLSSMLYVTLWSFIICV